jgi:hypothetical protein
MFSRIAAIGLLSLWVIISAGFASAQIDQGLVGYYPFSGNANDQSGMGNHGMVYGATLTQDRFGMPDSAFAFDGVSNYIDLGSNDSLKMTEGLTISVWINVPSFSTRYQNIISDHGPNETIYGPGKILRLEYSKVQFHVGGIYGYGTAVFVEYDLGNLRKGQWIHVVGTYDRNKVTLFIDGSPVATKSYSKPLTQPPNPVI